MGFDAEYTSAAVPTKSTAANVFAIRCSVLGNSFHTHSISFLITHLLDVLYGASLKYPFKSFCWTGSLEPFKGGCFEFGPGINDDVEDGRRLVYEYLRVAERGGSDVRLDLQSPFSPRAWLARIRVTIIFVVLEKCNGIPLAREVRLSHKSLNS